MSRIACHMFPNIMQSITVSAPSKLHLSGEHAVVSGKPAVLVATSKRLSVTISCQPSAISNQTKNNVNVASSVIPDPRVIPAKAGILDIKIPDQVGDDSVTSIRKSDKYIDHICQVFEKKHSLVIGNLSLIIQSDIPVGCGMGSSAALATALIGALSQFYKIPWNLSQINELAYKAEKFIHVNASGGDTSISCMGGLLWFRREFEFLKTFWSLPFRFPVGWQDFVLIDTGRSETTGDLVSFVLEQKTLRLRSGNNLYEDLFNQTEKVTKQMVLAIKLNDEKLFELSIKQNEKLLEQIGVVSKKTKNLIRQIEKKGGVAKISGVGGIKTGSGIVIGYHQKPEVIKQIAKENGYNTFQVKLGGEGVKIEKLKL